ncbi:MAG: DUF4856 domain-containing protein [Flavobacterium sp. MedPE-SWcel]|uniref:DUF4856 domain-containing protein n=1 Tax=uncultured Flavobacterium sp. TaxID=165435 RepID=UPI000921D8AA|nr:DUF4856 domain-containing protein [uncultured Flavobacterium sp.]OIQ19289.1 MAG: DUF4856 domain-containing protein [Flavobacterium sp. MedPE-SWcel]
MKKLALGLFIAASALTSCSSDDDNTVTGPTVVAPATYEFVREGNSTVSFGGQTTRIQMAEELVSAMKDNTNTQAQLEAMFAHVEGENDFNDADLNASGKNVRSKTAASTDYFAANTTAANAIKADFDGWITGQATEVFPNWATTASSGVAGNLQELGSETKRYIAANGLEYNQAFAKSLIGALMTDQMLNNYLSPAVLDAGDNRTNNDADILDEGKDYTTMEHKWDEAYGYLYGNETNPASPVLGADSFLNKYLSRVDGDTDFAGVANDVYNAFKLGRAAIVAKNYTVRDEQAKIIREKISLVIAVRASHYLQAGAATLATDKASAFHDLSEGFGFVYSLQFTRMPNTTTPYFTKAEVDTFISELLAGNGFWDATPEALNTMSDTIAAKFGFTSAQAAN